MISYEASFSVKPLMSANLGGGLQWPIGTILSIAKTNSNDHAGNYTCAPATLISDSVLVHIIDEGKIPPAAVYGDSSSSAGTPSKHAATPFATPTTSAFYWTLVTCFVSFVKM